MSLHSIRLKFMALALSLLVSACGGRGGPAAPPAGGITVTPGNTQVTVTWIAEPGVEYWLLYGLSPNISVNDLSVSHRWATNITSPYVLTGLANGSTYYFTMNARIGGGSGGDGTPTVSAVPRPAGATWSPGGAMGASNMRGIAYGTASGSSLNYVAVGDAGAIYRGTDGINWTAVSTGPNVNFRAALYTLGEFIAIGAAGTIYHSADMATWTAATSNTVNNLNALASNGALVVAVGDNGTILYSNDKNTWTAASAVPTANHLYGVVYAANGRWVAVGAGGTLLSSTDASNWIAAASGTTQDLNGVAVNSAYTYIGVGANGAVVRSTDGVNWSAQAVSPAAGLFAVNASANQFLAVGAGGTAFTSPDGVTWTSQTTGTALNLLALTGSSTQYFAIGQSGLNISSK